MATTGLPSAAYQPINPQGEESWLRRINAHAWTIEQTAKELGTDLTKGLTSAEARARLEKYGPNELKEKPRPGFFSLLLDQFKDFLIIILIASAVLSILLGEWIDAIVILAIVALNSIIGVVQESKAEAVAGRVEEDVGAQRPRHPGRPADRRSRHASWWSATW